MIGLMKMMVLKYFIFFNGNEFLLLFIILGGGVGIFCFVCFIFVIFGFFGIFGLFNISL